MRVVEHSIAYDMQAGLPVIRTMVEGEDILVLYTRLFSSGTQQVSRHLSFEK